MMFMEERKEKIISYLRANKRVTVEELTELFGVTGTTIRTDLKELEATGLLLRTYGGAILKEDKLKKEDSLKDRNDKNITEKALIVRNALELVEEGETILIDAGTTLFEFAKSIAASKKVFTVVTNDLRVALELQKSETIDVIQIGGKIRNNFECVTGSMGLRFLEALHVDRLFLSADAVSAEKGVTTPNIDQAEMKKRMMELSPKAYLLCDSTKFDKRTLCVFSKVSDFDLILTDEGLNEENRIRLMDKGARLKICR